MRIFSWVHRRFTPKDGSSEQNLRKDEQQLSHHHEADTKALLLDEDDYQGILSIGTFGQLFINTSNVSAADGDHEDAMVEADDPPPHEQENDEDPLLYSTLDGEDGEDDDETEKKTKERITLAELFSAESEDDHRHHTFSKSGTASTAGAPPGGGLFVKKNKSGDSRPIQKLHGLMKRMLKRKIHPAADLNDLTKPPASLHPSKSASLCRDAPPQQQVWT